MDAPPPFLAPPRSPVRGCPTMISFSPARARHSPTIPHCARTLKFISRRRRRRPRRAKTNAAAVGIRPIASSRRLRVSAVVLCSSMTQILIAYTRLACLWQYRTPGVPAPERTVCTRMPARSPDIVIFRSANRATERLQVGQSQPVHHRGVSGDTYPEDGGGPPLSKPRRWRRISDFVRE